MVLHAITICFCPPYDQKMLAGSFGCCAKTCNRHFKSLTVIKKGCHPVTDSSASEQEVDCPWCVTDDCLLVNSDWMVRGQCLITSR